MTTTDSTFDTFVAEMRRAEAEACATECGVQDCDGTYHEAGVDPREWHHQIESTADGILQLEIVLDEEDRAHACILAAFDDDTFDSSSGDDVRALADRLEAEPARLRAFAERLDRRSAPDQRIKAVAANVRGCLSRSTDGLRTSAKQLAQILEVSTQRARDLYNDREPFTLDELGLLSTYFGCDVRDWMTERGPIVGYPFDRDAAEDRLVTARESATRA